MFGQFTGDPCHRLLTVLIDFGEVPTEGVTVPATATGDLTINELKEAVADLGATLIKNSV